MSIKPQHQQKEQQRPTYVILGVHNESSVLHLTAGFGIHDGAIQNKATDLTCLGHLLDEALLTADGQNLRGAVGEDYKREGERENRLIMSTKRRKKV